MTTIKDPVCGVENEPEIAIARNGSDGGMTQAQADKMLQNVTSQWIQY